MAPSISTAPYLALQCCWASTTVNKRGSIMRTPAVLRFAIIALEVSSAAWRTWQGNTMLSVTYNFCLQYLHATFATGRIGCANKSSQRNKTQLNAKNWYYYLLLTTTTIITQMKISPSILQHCVSTITINKSTLINNNEWWNISYHFWRVLLLSKQQVRYYCN